jgi:hypothetical protein
MTWRSAHQHRLALHVQRLEAQRHQLNLALSQHSGRLARSTGRRRTLQRLASKAGADEDAKADRLQQLETEQHSGWRIRQSETTL